MFNYITANSIKNHSSSLLAVWLMLVCLLPTSALAVPTQWQWGHPFPHGNQINAAAWGARELVREFVAVGEGGSVITSELGLPNTWTLQTSGTTQALNDIAWNGDDTNVPLSDERYVSVGDQGTIISRTKSEEWSVRTSGTTDKLTRVIWVKKAQPSDSFFLAIGEYTASIDDPINSTISRPAATILTSTDGFNWTLEVARLNPDRYNDIPPPRLNGITWDGTLFIASSDNGAILTSDDGIDWHTRSINSIAWSGADYLAVGDNGLALTSDDGTNWTILNSGVTENLYDAVWEGGYFVIIGESGTIINATKGTPWAWNIEDSNTTEALHGITALLGTLISVGDNGTIRTRSNKPATPPPSWVTKDLGITENLHDVTWHLNGIFTYVVVGSNGRVLITNNLIDWKVPGTVPTGFSTDLLSVTWGAGNFVATGKDGVIITSTINNSDPTDDGDTWLSQTTPASISGEWLFDSIGNSFSSSHIVVGSNGTLITSSDGITWSTQDSGTTQTLYSITSDGTSRLLGGGEHAIQITSTDATATTWNASNDSPTQENLNDILFGNGIYIAIGNAGSILTSNDTVYWSSQTSGTTNDLFSLALDLETLNNEFLVSGAWGTLLRGDTTGTGWAPEAVPSNPAPASASFFYDVVSSFSPIAPFDSIVVTVGSGGEIYNTTDNGASWDISAGPTQTQKDINALTTSDSLLVAVGDNGVILNSTNAGVEWFSQTSCTSDRLHSVAWKDTTPTRFIAIGDAGAVCISDDGSDWTADTPNTPPDTSSALYGIAWGDDQFIAVGGSFLNSVIYTSPDGEDWTLRNSNEPFILRDIVWNKDHFIAVGDGGTITTSPRGISWTRNSSGTTTDLNNIAISEDRMIATGKIAAPFSTLILRNEGDTWDGGSGPELDNVHINDLSFGGTQFIGVGPSGSIVVSEDGQKWTEISTGTNSLFKAVTWDESKFVAAGVAGHILYAKNPDLVITGDFTTEKVRDGESARYIFSVTNRGITTATNVNYAGELPLGSTFVSASNSRGSCSLVSSLTCQLGDMATDETATITIDIATTAVGVQLHKGTVTSDVVDSDEANNTISIDLEVTRGNNEMGGAAFSYWSLAGTLLFLLITKLNLNRRNKW